MYLLASHGFVSVGEPYHCKELPFFGSSLGTERDCEDDTM